MIPFPPLNGVPVWVARVFGIVGATGAAFFSIFSADSQTSEQPLRSRDPDNPWETIESRIETEDPVNPVLLHNGQMNGIAGG